jgi:hypothetical protein
MTNSFFKTITARPVGNAFRIFQVLFLILAQVGGAMYGVQPALAAPVMAVDDAGADDEPGQKDLNALAVDYGLPSATTINVKWNWDNTATSGANTRDAGALFDTDGDGFANFSFYVTVASDGTWITQLYACAADNRTDRCAGQACSPHSVRLQAYRPGELRPIRRAPSTYLTPATLRAIPAATTRLLHR